MITRSYSCRLSAEPNLPRRTSRLPLNPSGRVTRAWPECLWRRYTGMGVQLLDMRQTLLRKIPRIARVLTRTSDRRKVRLTSVRQVTCVDWALQDLNL